MFDQHCSKMVINPLKFQFFFCYLAIYWSIALLDLNTFCKSFDFKRLYHTFFMSADYKMHRFILKCMNFNLSSLMIACVCLFIVPKIRKNTLQNFHTNIIAYFAIFYNATNMSRVLCKYHIQRILRNTAPDFYWSVKSEK